MKITIKLISSTLTKLTKLKNLYTNMNSHTKLIYENNNQIPPCKTQNIWKWTHIRKYMKIYEIYEILYMKIYEILYMKITIKLIPSTLSSLQNSKTYTWTYMNSYTKFIYKNNNQTHPLLAKLKNLYEYELIYETYIWK